MRGLDHLPVTELTKLLSQYLLAGRLEKSPKTLLNYGESIGYFIRFLVDSGIPANLAEINQNHIRLFLLGLQDRHLAAETVSVYYRALHTFFNWLENEELLTKNPFNKLRVPRVPRKLIHAWPQEIVNNILAVCLADTSFTGRRNCALALIFFDTGVRQLEMAGMKLDDIFIDQGLIRVMGKGGKERIVRMGESAQKALLRYLLKRRDQQEAVWVSEEGQPLRQAGIQIAMRRLAQRAGVPNTVKRGTHSFRHTAATSYLRNHGNVKCLQEMLGHEHITTTMKYVDALGPEAMIEDHKLASPVDNFLRHKVRARKR